MTSQLWIGFGFLAFLILVMVYTLLWDDSKRTDRQYVTLKFLTALSAGFAGGFLSGEALFKITGSLGSVGDMAISGTAGAALFFTIWFTYKIIIPDSFSFAIEAGWKFDEIVRKIVEADGSQVKLIGFTEEQKDTKFPKLEVKTINTRIALERLKLAVDTLPDYSIGLSDHLYTITVK